MLPRFIIKTHTEGLRPGLFSLILACCTSRDQSTRAEQICRRASEILLRAGKRRQAAVKFAVYAAWRHFEFLQESMAWAWRGAAMHAIVASAGREKEDSPLDYYELTARERAAYLKYYLEADGALLLSFSRLIAGGGGVSRRMLYDKAASLISDLYDSYVAAAADHRQRVMIKQRLAEVKQQMKGETYERGTLPHKVLPHLEAMEDLGLVRCDQRAGEVMYSPVEHGGKEATQELVDSVRDISGLETIVTKGNPFEVIGRCLGLYGRDFEPASDTALIRRILRDGYDQLRSRSTSIASIAALVDWSCTLSLTEHGILVSPDQVRERIDEMWRENPGTVRFHVDYDGRKSYVILDGK